MPGLSLQCFLLPFPGHGPVFVTVLTPVIGGLSEQPWSGDSSCHEGLPGEVQAGGSQGQQALLQGEWPWEGGGRELQSGSVWKEAM